MTHLFSTPPARSPSPLPFVWSMLLHTGAIVAVVVMGTRAVVRLDMPASPRLTYMMLASPRAFSPSRLTPAIPTAALRSPLPNLPPARPGADRVLSVAASAPADLAASLPHPAATIPPTPAPAADRLAGGEDAIAPRETRKELAMAAAEAGFGGGAPTAPRRADPVAVLAGFSLAPGPPTPAVRRGEVVRSAGFGDAGPASVLPGGSAPPPEPLTTQVEVFFKPRPEYSPEARELGIEGEIVLDVEFSANQDIHVFGVVRGLGHGLDEKALQAARGVRFKPATVRGHPVTVRASMTIVFRLV